MSAAGPNNDVTAFGRISRLLGKALSNGDQAFGVSRLGTYGEQVADILTGKQQKLADEGSLFVTRTPTPGTGVASIAAPTAYVATSPYLIVYNPPNSGKNIWLDRINLNLITPGTSSTDLQIATALDQIARYTSGGLGSANALATGGLAGPYPTNSGVAPASVAQIYAGALVAAAASNANRILINRYLRTVIAVAKETYEINFGACDQPLDGNSPATATLQDRSIPHPAVCLAPGGCFLLHLYGTAMAAATTCEVEVHHAER